jgi:hypothetical protein
MDVGKYLVPQNNEETSKEEDSACPDEVGSAGSPSRLSRFFNLELT